MPLKTKTGLMTIVNMGLCALLLVLIGANANHSPLKTQLDYACPIQFVFLSSTSNLTMMLASYTSLIYNLIVSFDIVRDRSRNHYRSVQFRLTNGLTVIFMSASSASMLFAFAGQAGLNREVDTYIAVGCIGLIAGITHTVTMAMAGYNKN